MNDLVTIDKVNALDLFTTQNGIDPCLSDIKDMVDSFHGDATTEKGRKEIKSFCYKLARLKAYIDNAGKELVTELKETPKLIDKERKRVRELLDYWAEICRKPLTDFEEAEQARINTIKEKMNVFDINFLILSKYDCTTIVDNLKALDLSTFQEFEEDAAKKKENALLMLRGRYADIIEAEKEAVKIAEQQRLEAIEREKQIRLEEQEKAKRQEEERLKEIARQKELAAQAEQRRIEAEEKARQDAIKAEEMHKKAIKQERINAEKRAKEQAERAEQERIEREEMERLELKKKEEARLADKKHRTKINNEALNALTSIVTEDQAKEVIKLIAKGLVPNVTINY